MTHCKSMSFALLLPMILATSICESYCAAGSLNWLCRSICPDLQILDTQIHNLETEVASLQRDAKRYSLLISENNESDCYQATVLLASELDNSRTTNTELSIKLQDEQFQNVLAKKREGKIFRYLLLLFFTCGFGLFII